MPDSGPKRRTQILSLEPPKRNKGPQIARDARMDGLAGPSTQSARNRSLMGNIGREKTNPVPKPAQAANIPKPSLRRTDDGKPVDLGGANKKDMETMVVRRGGTRRIPKAGGGFQGEAAPLDSMASGRRPAVEPPAAPVAPRAEGRQQQNVPPVVNMPVPRANVPRSHQAPPPSANRGNTLAGVSAEELLGEEGKRMLAEMRRREQEARNAPPPPPQQQGGIFVDRDAPSPPQGPLQPRMQDSSRMAFQSAEYGAQQDMQAVQPDDELRPQDFLRGPQQQQDVVQTPMPAQGYAGEDGGYGEYTEEPPPDDLGYERPVDFGDSNREGTDSEPQARESAAHDEMEQRAGYLLWLQGVITREEIEDALNQSEVSDAVRELLLENAFTDQVTLYRFLARHESVAPVDLERVRPSNAALAVLRPAIARSYRVVPIARVGEVLLVAAAFPFDPRRLLELRRLTASKVKLFVVTEQEIDDALATYYPPASAATLRSPKPGEGANDDSAITGEGDALEQSYDPTLSGSDSGLYAPIDPNAPPPPSSVGMSELDEGFDAQSETGRHAAVNDSDLDESSIGDGPAVSEADELDLGAPKGGSLETGRPEDLDPFGE